MILEIAQFDIKPGLTAEFEANVTRAQPLFQRAKGCHGMELHRSSEVPTRYRLLVQWEAFENHTVISAAHPDFQECRRLVGHCFATARYVEHTTRVWFGCGEP